VLPPANIVVSALPFSDGSDSGESFALMTRALDEAHAAVAEATFNGPALDCTGFRTIMTIRILGAIKDGERNPEQLVLAALSAVKDLY
jgi:hypothetical protein